MSDHKWELIGDIERMKVDGGHIYKDENTGDTCAMVFVPDVDLTRYQAHLRDAYNAGFKDGLDQAQKEAAT